MSEAPKRKPAWKTARNKELRKDLKRVENNTVEAREAAKKTEMLLLEEQGFLEAETEMEATHKVTQEEIKASVDISTKKKAYDLKLPDFGPYDINFSRTGRKLLIGGRKGHVAAFDWREGRLQFELNLNETVRAVQWLHNDQYFAVAQKKNVFIYDHQGSEVHRLKQQMEMSNLDFLPYHYLLVSSGLTSMLFYQDVSIGKQVAAFKTRLGPTTAQCANPYNAIMNLGHSNGTVTMWSPNVDEPLVKMLAHRGPVNDVSVDRSGRYLATAGSDSSVKVWDIRNTYKEVLRLPRTRVAAQTVNWSDSNLLSVGHGNTVTVWKDVQSAPRPKQPYMNHNMHPDWKVSSAQFVPFEDILGVGHSEGFSSLIIPGAGEANFDALEVNPYQTRHQRREEEVRTLLQKLQPEMITMDPDDIGRIAMDKDRRRKTAREQMEEITEPNKKRAQESDDDMPELQPHLADEETAVSKELEKKKKKGVVDERQMRLEQLQERERRMRENKKRRLEEGYVEEYVSPAISRFQQRQ